MQYIVKGSDGQDYGPVGVDELKIWIAENRLSPQTELRDFNSGAIMAAQAVPGLFASPAPQIYSPPMTPPMAALPQAQAKEDMGPLWGVILRSLAAVAVFFLLHGLGLIFAGYALFYAIQCKMEGSKYGWLAIIIALAAVATVGVGWMLRFSGAKV